MQTLVVTFICIKAVNVYILFTKQTIKKVHPRNRIYLIRFHMNKTFDAVLPFSILCLVSTYSFIVDINSKPLIIYASSLLNNIQYFYK